MSEAVVSPIPPNSHRRLSHAGTILWLVLFMAVAGVALRVRLHDQAVTERTPDERVYMADATRITESGPGAIRALVADLNQTRDQWIYPPPTRVGFIFLVAGVMKITGATAEGAAVWISFVFSLLGLCITGLLGWRLFNRWVGLIAMAFLSVSPLDLALARRAWQDSVVGGVGTLLLYFCAEASLRPAQKRWRVGFWIVAAYFLLLKESALVIYGLLVLWLLVDIYRNDLPWRRAVSFVLTSGLVVAFSYGIAIWLSGGLHPFLQVYHHMAQGLTWNDYVYRYQCGPWYSFPLGLFALSPMTTLLCGCGIGLVLFRAQSLRRILCWDDRQVDVGIAIASFICAALIAVTLPEGFKCLRYISVLQAPIYLLAGIAVTFFVNQLRSQWGQLGGYVSAGIALVVIVSVCWTDYARFKRIVVRDRLDDLAIVRVVDEVFLTDRRPATPPPEEISKWKIQTHGSAEQQIESTPEYQLARSLAFYNSGRYQESIAAATKALELNPDYAAAWNNIGAAYNSLGQFDKAIGACEEALRLQPRFPLAQHNLEFARKMSRRH